MSTPETPRTWTERRYDAIVELQGRLAGAEARNQLLLAARGDRERRYAREVERITVGLIEATDLMGELINGYKIDEAAQWLTARGFLADDEPESDTLAGLLFALEGDALREYGRLGKEES